MDAQISAKNFVKLNKKAKKKPLKFKERNEVKQRQTKPFNTMYTK